MTEQCITTIGELTGQNSHSCYLHLKYGSFYDSVNDYVVYFDVVNLNRYSYKESKIRIKMVEPLS